MKKFNGLSTYIFGSILTIVFSLISVNCFYLNTNLTTGWISGLSLSIMYILNLFHIKVTFGILYFLLNCPLFVISWLKINRRFTLFSIFNVVMTSILSDILPVYKLTNDLLINCIFGGITFAIAILASFRYGQSTGGTDILGIYFAKKGKGSIGSINIMISTISFLIILFVKDFKILAYSLISEVVCSVTIDSFYKAATKESVIIISNKYDKINQKLLHILERGSTMIDITGGYSKDEKKLIYIVISSDQLDLLKSVVKAIDKDAFVSNWSTSGTLGEWTNRIGEHSYTIKHKRDLIKNLADIEE